MDYEKSYPRLIDKPHSVGNRLFTARTLAIIYLGCMSPCISCSLPETTGVSLGDEQPPTHKGFASAWPCSWRGLPGRNHYWLRRWSLTPPFHPHWFNMADAMLNLSGMFLWPDPAGYPAPGITRRLALWSADFPRLRLAKPRSPDQPG